MISSWLKITQNNVLILHNAYPSEFPLGIDWTMVLHNKRILYVTVIVCQIIYLDLCAPKDYAQ